MKRDIIKKEQIVEILNTLSGVEAWKCEPIGNNTFKIYSKYSCSLPSDSTLKRFFAKYGYSITIWTSADFFHNIYHYSVTVERIETEGQ